MTPPSAGEGQDEATGERNALQAWAESIEQSFNEIRQSLTSPDTAAAFLRTLDVLERTLQGSRAKGIITAGQLAELTALIDGMRKVPSLL